MKKIINSALFIAYAGMFFVSCSDTDTQDENPDNNQSFYKEVLSDLALNVITETYRSLNAQALTLQNAVDAMSVGDENALTTAKVAWQQTRAPWEQSEGFLYGPVDTEGIDPAIDSWPVDVNAINNILNSGNPITQSLLESNNEARGFHTLEYFLWGLEGTKPASALTNRELEYLKAAAANLQSKTEELYSGWLVSQGNFAGNFINAGNTGSIYASQKSALQEIAEGLSIIADEVANGKIEEPLNGNNGSAKPEAEESRFSNNSKLDFANNIRSIQNIYLGNYAGNVNNGLSAIVSENDSSLDVEIENLITDAINTIEAIPGTFTEAIINNREAVAQAQQKVRALQTLLDSKLLPLMSGL